MLMQHASRTGTEEGKAEDNPRVATDADLTVPNTATDVAVQHSLTLQEEITKPQLIKISNRKSTTNATQN